MPAKDKYHDTVKRALLKAGWHILGEQLYLSDNQRHVWIDLRAQQSDNPVLLIEIKGFEGNASLIDALMAAIGQYAIYKAMIDYLKRSELLYLAVPKAAYEGIFQAPVAQQVLKNLGVRLTVFDPETEEVILWIP
jgi:hypothetical protein